MYDTSTDAVEEGKESDRNKDHIVQGINMTKLVNARKYSQRKFRPYLTWRLDAMREYVGFNYSEHASDQKEPINLFQFALATYNQHLSSSAPQANIVSADPSRQKVATAFKQVGNYLFRKIKLKETIRKAVLDALFLFGVIRVGVDGFPGIVQGSDAADRDLFPFADAIDPSMFIMDMRSGVADYSQCQFAGHRWSMAREAAMDSDLFDKGAKKIIERMSSACGEYNESDARSTEIGDGEAKMESTEFMDTIEGWEMWLPYQRKIVTLAGDTNQVLRIEDWTGPYCGPYQLLSLGKVPGNLIPLSPAMNLFDAATLFNTGMVKVAHEMNAEKNVYGVRPGGEDDASAILNAPPEGVIKIEDPNSMQTIKVGGVSQNTLAFLLQLKGMYSYIGGGLDSLSGAQEAGTTLGQEQILQAGSKGTVKIWGDNVVDFTGETIRSLLYFAWEDPVGIVKNLRFEDPKMRKYSVPFDEEVLGGEERGELDDYQMEITPYGQQDKTPEQKLNAVENFVQRYVLPFAPMLQEQGLSPDFQELARLAAEYQNVPEIERVLRFSAPPQNGPSPGQDPAQQAMAPMSMGKPPTSHEYIRRGAPAAPSTAQKDQMAAHLMSGGNAQPKEKATVGK